LSEKAVLGIIAKALGGFYYVKTAQGQIECRARGVFRNKGVTPFVGDKVKIELTHGGKGYVTEIMPRKNSLIRPPIANIDYLVMVVSVASPPPNLFVLDKLIAIAEYKNIEPVIAITKCDLASPDELAAIYKAAGFKVFCISAIKGEGIEQFVSALAGSTAAFCGNSGAGKSSLLNAIDSRFNIETADISKKLGRGRHTTRHIELYELENGAVVADTPGFSAIETEYFDVILKQELQHCFREFEQYIGKCRFKGCSHICEKGCAVLDAVKNGEIPPSRHESYIQMYRSAENIKEWELNR